jgi:dolichol kinase
VTFGIDLPLTVPLGMLLVDSFGALIGVAILKHQLFDIAGIVKKRTVYSALAVVIIFVFSLSAHLMTTYLTGAMGALSEYASLVFIVLVVAAFLPLRKRLERTVSDYFAKKKVAVEF